MDNYRVVGDAGTGRFVFTETDAVVYLGEVDHNAEARLKYYEDSRWGGDMPEEPRSDWEFFVVVELASGKRFGHRVGFKNVDVAKRMMKKVEAKGELELVHWMVLEPAYGTPAWEGHEWRLYDAEERAHYLGMV